MTPAAAAAATAAAATVAATVCIVVACTCVSAAAIGYMSVLILKFICKSVAYNMFVHASSDFCFNYGAVSCLLSGVCCLLLLLQNSDGSLTFVLAFLARDVSRLLRAADARAQFPSSVLHTFAELAVR